MSEPIRRRGSSRALLQNLIRVTAQRSQEDAEELERERRRRAREKQRGEGSPPPGSEPPQPGNLTPSTESDEELKPGLGLEEDEGFSDWSHRLENRQEPEAPEDCSPKEHRPSGPARTPAPAHPEEQRRQGPVERGGPEEPGSSEASARAPEKASSSRSPRRTSYSSSVFLPQEARRPHASDRTSYLAAGTMKPRGGASRVDGDVEPEARREGEEEEEEEEKEEGEVLQRDLDSAETLSSQTEEMSFTPQERGVLHMGGEQRPGESHQDQQRRPEERTLVDGEAEEPLTCYGPMSPTFKKLLIQFYPDEVSGRASTDGKCTITEKAESLRRSSSSTKKTPPPVSVSKIDKRLEQYTHALEVGRSGGQQLAELTAPSQPVASKKNLFQSGEAWTHSAPPGAAPKDAEGLKVAVSELINQWVRGGGEDGGRCSSPSKPAEIKPGGVLNKKNLWESLGDTLSSSKDGKEGSAKRYKFVVTGHGKYEKVPGENICLEDPNCQAAEQVYEDL